MKRSPFKPKAVDPKTGELRFSTFKKPTKPSFTRDVSPLLRSKPMERKAMKWKRRKPKPGDEPRYKAWIKSLPCVVGGLKCGKADPHHLIDGNGDARKGMSQTAPDRYLLPLCRAHHDLFHEGKGIFAHFDKALRLTFQEEECERLRSIWADLNELDVWQEPARKAV